jgi:mRNA-degrading endonuclease RelE of RelBE toxin-antitoxin system
MTDSNKDAIRHQVHITGAAARSLDMIPPRLAEPLVAFLFGSLADNPRRRGKPLQRELAGRWSARRGDYRVVYAIDDTTMTVTVLLVDHRAHVYRRR